MSKLLCIETSTDVCSVCIADEGNLIGVAEFQELKHSSMLVPLIHQLMQDYTISFNDLKAIAVSKGPGSYTGLRVGVSTAKGLAYARDLPLIGINTLESLALHSKKQFTGNQIDFIVPMMDARRDEVYTAVFDHCGSKIEETQSLVLNASYPDRLSEGQSYLFCGNGMQKVVPYLKAHSNVHFLDSRCSSLGMISIAHQYFQKGTYKDLDSFGPLYLKPPNITTPKKTFSV